MTIAAPLDKEGIEALKAVSNLQTSPGLGADLDESSVKPAHETFIEITGIPSKSFFYKSIVKGQSLKVEDLLVLSNFDEDNVQDKFNEIFSRRLLGIKAREILAGDELFLAFWLRESAFPDMGFPTIGHTCNSCGFNNPAGSINFSINDVNFEIKDFDKIAAEFQAGNGTVTITLPHSKKEYKIYLRKRGHNERINEFIKKEYYVNNIEPPENIGIVLSLAVVLNVNEQPLKATVDEIKELAPRDFIYLTKQIKKYSLVNDPIINMPCVRCKEKTPVSGYTFLPSTFFPIEED